ncbi:MAG: phenylalanine--tRNA ligase subunit beta [Myxococcota bacterium]
MKISIDVLRRYTALPDGAQAIQDLLDDVGIEVKRNDGDRLTVELLANRGDHRCYAGIAREVHGRTGKGIHLPDTAPLQRVDHSDIIPLRVETERCLAYSLTLLALPEDVTAGVLPEDVLAPLDAAEIHSITAAVDATNLSNYEFGQPTHAFDADKVNGEVVVRLSTPGEDCWPLFSDSRVALPVGTLVIADQEKILAIAGVIGCEDSKTTEATRRILLESATFDPVTVRKAHRALNIHTDSAARFERGADPEAPLVGAGRVVYLLEQHAGWQRMGPTVLRGGWVDPANHLTVDVGAVNAFLQTDLSSAEVSERLSRYGFQTTDRDGEMLMVKVPPHRLWDVAFRADLYEELAKSIGYNDTPIALPPTEIGARMSAEERRQERVEEVLLANGFYEVITDGFYGRDMRELLNADDEAHPLYPHVNTLNSLERGYSLLKNNALGHLVEAIDKNIRARYPSPKMYEWTRVFIPDPTAENEVCRERRVLTAIASGAARARTWAEPARPIDPFFLKGIVEELAVELALPLTIHRADARDPLFFCLHPNRQASIRLRGQRVGILGEVHPAIVENFRIKRARPCYLEIDQDALLEAGDVRVYTPPPVHQPIVRSLAFALPFTISAGDIQDAIFDAGPSWLDNANIVDEFRFEEDGQPMRAITYELSYANTRGDRSADEVNALTEEIVAAIHARYGEQGVAQRT